MESSTQHVVCTAVCWRSGERVRSGNRGIVHLVRLVKILFLEQLMPDVLLLLYPCGLLQHLSVWMDSSTFGNT